MLKKNTITENSQSQLTSKGSSLQFVEVFRFIRTVGAYSAHL